MASPFKDNVNSRLLLDHVDVYSRASRTCAQQLATIYADLELDGDAQRAELDEICGRATNVWNAAVEDATARRNELRQQVEDALKEVQKIKQQLGDDAIQAEIESELAQLQASGPIDRGSFICARTFPPALLIRPATLRCALRLRMADHLSPLPPQDSGVLSPRKSLKAWFDETKKTLEMWRSRKALRLQEYEELQVCPASCCADCAALVLFHSTCSARQAALPRAAAPAPAPARCQQPAAPPLTLPAAASAPAAPQLELKALKQQMGQPTAAPPGTPDITRSSLELLRLEKDKAINERVGGWCCWRRR